MYVTMMMTDQIPLDLAPPPLLNGEVPLMPHMVNGDAAQQVNSHQHKLTHTHRRTCIQLNLQNDHANTVTSIASSFNIPMVPHTHTHTHTHIHHLTRDTQTYPSVIQPLLFVVICYTVHGFLPHVMDNCQVATVKHLSFSRKKDTHRFIHMHHSELWTFFKQ